MICCFCPTVDLFLRIRILRWKLACCPFSNNVWHKQKGRIIVLSLLGILEILQKHFLKEHLDCAHSGPWDFLCFLLYSKFSLVENMSCLGSSKVLKAKAGLHWDLRGSSYSNCLAKEWSRVPGWSWSRLERKASFVSQDFLPRPSVKSASRPTGRDPGFPSGKTLMLCPHVKPPKSGTRPNL